MTLPKLPIPSLELTLQNFKLATTAFLTDEEFETVSEACKELEGASGSAIQRYLLDRQEKHDNWAYDWWLEDMYLKNSLPLPIHSNPGMIFPRETFKTTEEFIRYVSCFVEEAYKFKIKIDRNLIPQDRASSRERNQPLCMLQYQRIFSSYRESGYSKDNLLEYEPNNNSHFIVAAKGQFFVVQYMTEKSTLSFEDLYIELAQIYKSSQQQQEKVGLLTAAKRRHSATLFENLMKDKQNNDNVCTIRSAAFIICLDDNPGTDSESGRMAQMIHGGGVSKNSTNRWFNKTMQFIFSESGSCGLCYEHSPAEGIVVVQMVEDILKNCAERESGKIHLVENRTAKIPKKLIWKLEKCLQQEIDNIGTELDREMENLDVLIHTYDGYGKELVKKNSISPDVFIQVVLQLTYYRIYGCLGATYESASTRRFRKGRVDCIRAATPEALEWVKAMTSEGALNEERLSKFKRAVNAQTKIMTDNILGRGIDIHLMGIKEAAKELGIKLSLFDSPAFKKANHFCLSTSQITTRLNSVMGYGPVVPEGHGVSYNIQRESFKFCISSFKSFESASSKTFAKSLDESLNRVQQLLLSQNFTNRTSLV